MMKFFRKYNKTLLAVFMVLLMVVFVGGSALQSLLTPTTNETIAESRFGPIKRFDQSQAKASTDILRFMGINWQFLGNPGNPLEIVDWLLLTREASNLDARVGDAAVESWLVESLGRDQISTWARRLRVKTDHIRAAIGELLSIQLAQQSIAVATVPSAAEVRSYGRRLLDKVSVDIVTLPAEAFADSDTTFTREQMEAHWSPLRDVEPGVGLNFGYYVPPKLAVEYVKIDPMRIAETIGIANLESKARRLYDRERTKNPVFARPPEQKSDTAAEEIEGPELERPPYLNWNEAKDAALVLIKEQQSREAATNLAQWLLQYDAERWFDSERDDNGYKKTPENVQQDGYYEEMLGHVPSIITYPNAVSVIRSAFFTKDEANDVSEIGAAFYSAPGTATRTFTSVAFRSAPIVPKIPDDAGSDREEFLALYQTCHRVLKDRDGNTYVLRIVDSQAAHASESVDEVEDRVLEDMRLVAGLEKAKAVAEGLRSCSPDITLREAFDSDESLADLQAMGEGVGFYEAESVTRMDMYEVGSSALRMGKYVNIGVGLVPHEIIDRWFQLEDAWERTEMFELKDRATILVTEWKSSEPARHDEFEDKQDQIVQQLTSQRLRDAVADWFDPEKIRARSGFELVR